MVLPGNNAVNQKEMLNEKYVDELLKQSNDRFYFDFCRLLAIMQWNV